MAEVLTRPSLLLRIRDLGDREAWRQFVEVYGPLVYGFARRRGLQDADAADLTQEVLRSVARAAGRLEYDPRRGTFRSWLFTVAHREVCDFLAGRRRRPPGTGDTTFQARLEEQAAPEDEALWNQEHERRLLAQAMAAARGAFGESTWRAFWLTAVEGHKAQEAARQLQTSVVAVYKAKSRVLAHLRHHVRQAEGF
jgi:RNA polymerase sigma factor (sigma-70 family)